MIGLAPAQAYRQIVTFLTSVLAPALDDPTALVYCALFALLAGVAWWSSRLTRRTLPEETPALAARLAPLLPYATLVVAAFVPLAAGVYLLVSTAWSTLERTAFAARPVRPASS